MVRKENASSKISAGIDEVINLLKVRMTAACIHLFGLSHCAGIWAQTWGGGGGWGNENIDDIVLCKVFLFDTFLDREVNKHMLNICLNLFCICGSRFFYLDLRCFLLSIVFYKN